MSSDIPPKSHLVAKGSTNFGPVDLSSDVPQQYLVAKGSINLGPDDLSHPQ